MMYRVTFTNGKVTYLPEHQIREVSEQSDGTWRLHFNQEGALYDAIRTIEAMGETFKLQAAEGTSRDQGPRPCGGRGGRETPRASRQIEVSEDGCGGRGGR